VTDFEYLNIYPWSLWPEWQERVKEAKGSLETNIKVVPREARPGCGRVLAFEEPPFACEYGLIQSGAGLAKALECYLGLATSSQWRTMADSLATMDPRLIGTEEIHQ